MFLFGIIQLLFEFVHCIASKMIQIEKKIAAVWGEGEKRDNSQGNKDYYVFSSL